VYTTEKIEECLHLPIGVDTNSTHPPLFEYTSPPKQTEWFFHYPPIFLLNHSIWFSDKIRLRNDYKARTSKDYNVEFFPVDFPRPPGEIQKKLNEWIHKIGQGKVPSITPSLPEETVFWLLQTLYFKAHWKIKFQHINTEQGKNVVSF